MRWRRIRHGITILIPAVSAVGGLLTGCYYDPYAGYPYPPAPSGYGYPLPGGPGPQPAVEPPPEGPPPPGAYAPGGPPAQEHVVTRDQFIQRAVQRATQLGRDPQRAAQLAASVFDQIDVGHTGAVTPDQIRAWRAARRYAPNPAEMPPQSE
jgi:hypothetical protein